MLKVLCAGLLVSANFLPGDKAFLLKYGKPLNCCQEKPLSKAESPQKFFTGGMLHFFV